MKSHSYFYHRKIAIFNYRLDLIIVWIIFVHVVELVCNPVVSACDPSLDSILINENMNE